jgi:hypothetical protein
MVPDFVLRNVFAAAGVGLDPRPAPFPLLEMPSHVAAEVRDAQGSLWELKTLDHLKETPPYSRGYYRGYLPVPHRESFFVLMQDRSIWMSPAMMELESQGQMAQEARGRVFVGGLGMGVLLWNIARKVDVEEVVCVEQNAAVIEIMRPSIDAWSLATRAKIKVVHENVFAQERMRALGRFDFAMIDIWPCVGDTALRDDMRNIVKGVHADYYGAWTVELDVIFWAREQGLKPSKAVEDPEFFRNYCNAMGIRYIGYYKREMPKLCFAAAEQFAFDYIEKGYNRNRKPKGE